MRSVILLSGGIDSSTLAYKLCAEGHETLPLTVIYGQRHKIEVQSAKAIARSLDLKLKIADLSSCRSLFSGSALTSDIAVPEGHYEDESMKLTVVPNRNMVLLSLAAAYAVSVKAQGVAYAAHGGDHAIYADCRPDFAQKMREAIQLATGIELLPEFITMSKSNVVALGLELKVPFGLTRSCYKGREKACGCCGTCFERIEAFKLNHTIDPISYEISIDWRGCK